MVGLVDAFGGSEFAAETVSVRGKAIAVPGVSAKGIAYLLTRFPDLRALMAGRKIEEAALLAMGGDAVAAIIAAGTGAPGDDKAEAIAGTLPLDAQADLIAAILKVTMPQGVGPFVEKLTGLGLLVGGDPFPAVPDTKSTKRSMSSSAPATTKAGSGTAHPAN